MPTPQLPSAPRPARPVIVPHPMPPIGAPKPVQFRSSSYSGIGSMPFDPRSAARYTPPPFAPGAFMRPAPPPGPVTQLPAGLAGPIFPQVGWHFGPPVYLGQPPYGQDPCPPSKRGHIIGGYGSLQYGALNYGSLQYGEDTESSEKPNPKPSPGTMAALGGLALVSLALPIASSVVFGRKYGGVGYILGFFVPGAIGAATMALAKSGSAGPNAKPLR
jgi:hypothetical protein